MIWVLKDEKVGTSNQALGVALALGLPFVEKNVKYTKLSVLPNFLKSSTMGISNLNEILDDKNPPTLIISAGRRLVNFACYLKTKYRAKTVHLMNFGRYKRGKFDLIITPKHDGLKNLPKNMVSVIGSPSILSNETIKKAKITWAETFSPYKKPVLALIVGGSTKDRKFTLKMAQDLVAYIRSNFHDYSLFITTSRRTGAENEQAIFEGLKDMNPYFYGYKSVGANPYHGFLAYADKIVVTGDSMSMCSEAAFTGKPVYIYAPKDLISKKHMRFHNELCENNFACMLDEKADNNFVPSNKNFNPNQEIADIIRNRGFI